MFYYSKIDVVFRFGDVVRGFACSTPVIENPVLDGHDFPFDLEVYSSRLSVVLSPCCSIDKGILSLAPLQELIPIFFKNPWWVEDFTCLNRPMPAERTIPPHKWKAMSQEIKERELDLENDAYAFDDFFIYQEHPLLPQYTVDLIGQPNQETGCYMVDFKTAYRINCDKIKRDKEHPIDAKLLQLSKESRADLRNKITAYFARIPVEDQV